MNRRGVTLVEVIIVMAIVAILSALTFNLTASSRESARRSSCVSQLKQIYQGLTLYAADCDADALYPELHGLAYRADPLFYFSPYVAKELWLCPTVPSNFLHGRKSTYPSPLFFSPVDPNGQISQSRSNMIEKEKRQKELAGIVECTAHDEFFFARGERDVDPTIAHPYKHLLRVNGSVFKGRYEPPRDFPLTGGI